MSDKEARVIARLAWNNWPDNENSRREIAAHEARDPISAAAWDRVVAALSSREARPIKGNRFCAHDDCPYPDCLVDGICPSQPRPIDGNPMSKD